MVHVARSAQIGVLIHSLISTLRGPQVEPTSWSIANGFEHLPPSGQSFSDRQTSRWFSLLLSQCDRNTASKRKASTWARGEPPFFGSIRSSSKKAHPSTSCVSIGRPQCLCSMAAHSKSLNDFGSITLPYIFSAPAAPRVFIVRKGSSGQP